MLETAYGRTELRAVTSPGLWRHLRPRDRLRRQCIAGDGVGDTRWKVPGVLDWSTGSYDPMVEVTKDTTTLYASDRDVFLFLADDLNPIEVGLLPDGAPDLFFRDFYCWNSEVGAKTLGIASLYLCAVGQNRRSALPPRLPDPRRAWLSAVRPHRRPVAVPTHQQGLRTHLDHCHHQPGLERRAQRLR